MKNKKLIRLNFRDAVFSRDGHACKFCGKIENLDAHHITDRSLMPNGGYVLENGITVCEICHLMCEKYHMSDGKSWSEGKHPTDLYNMIGSSFETAVAKSSNR